MTPLAAVFLQLVYVCGKWLVKLALPNDILKPFPSVSFGACLHGVRKPNIFGLIIISQHGETQRDFSKNILPLVLRAFYY